VPEESDRSRGKGVFSEELMTVVGVTAVVGCDVDIEGKAARTVEMEAFEVLMVRRDGLPEAERRNRLSDGNVGRGGGTDTAGRDRRLCTLSRGEDVDAELTAEGGSWDTIVERDLGVNIRRTVRPNFRWGCSAFVTSSLASG